MKTEAQSKQRASITLQGIGVSPGIVVGKALVIEERPEVVFCFQIRDEDLDGEVHRFEQAVAKTAAELEGLKERLANSFGNGHSWILESHLLMIQDDLLVSRTIAAIRDERINAEWALRKVVSSLKMKFTNVDDAYFQERFQDIQDVGRRILHHLSPSESAPIPSTGEPMILIASDLSPSDTVQLDRRQISGIAIDSGSRTSHTSIIAKSLEIPAVVALHDVSRRVQTGSVLILDGSEGLVIVNPSETVGKEYTTKKKNQALFRKKLLESRELPAMTLDGQRIAIKANIEFPWEIESAISHGAEGIGLYRTEFMFLNRQGAPPSEEEHYEVYKGIAQQIAPRAAVIRTIDLGGDKFSTVLDSPRPNEANPLLGLRAIRFCLKRKDIFRLQLRAILRASVHGNLKILFPLVSSVDELREAKDFLWEIKEELNAASIPFDPSIPVGIMIEVPAAASIADLLAKEVDFFSIGTNDLIQYFLAVDRSNEEVSYLYQPIHPGLLRVLKFVVTSAKDCGIPTTLCGEMAAEPMLAFLLAGMGLNELSMDPGSIPHIKYLIRSIEYNEAAEIFERTASFSTAAEVEAYVLERVNRFFPRGLKMLFEE